MGCSAQSCSGDTLWTAVGRVLLNDGQWVLYRDWMKTRDGLDLAALWLETTFPEVPWEGIVIHDAPAAVKGALLNRRTRHANDPVLLQESPEG